MSEDVPSYWRNLETFLRLKGTKCNHCGETFIPPRKICPACGSSEMKSYIPPRKGKLLSWSVIKDPPKRFEKYAPYLLGIIQLNDGNKIIAQLTDVENKELTFGMPVKAVVRKLYEDGEDGLIHYGYKFVTHKFPND